METALFVENMKIPKVFFSDHVHRDLTVTKRISELGRQTVVIKETKQHYYVSLTKEEFDDLFSDADYYSEMYSTGEFREDFGLIRSAVATLKTMKKVANK